MGLIGDLGGMMKNDKTDKRVSQPLTLEEFGASRWPEVEEMLDSAQQALWEWRISEDRLQGTRQFYAILGSAPGEFGDSLYETLEALVHPRHQEYFRTALKEGLRTRAIDRFKFRIVRRDGQERWVMMRGRVLPEGDRVIGVLEDWTDIQSANLFLHENLDFMQSLLDAIPNPVFYKDMEGVYRFCNPAFSHMIGTHPRSILGKKVEAVTSAELAALYREKDLELFSSGGTQDYEAKVEVQNGDIHDYRLQKALCRDRRGVVTGLVGVMTDMTAYAAAINRSRRLAQLKEAMLEVSHAIIGLHNTQDLLALLLDKAIHAIPSSNAGSVLLIDKDGYLRMLVSRGYSTEGVETFKLKIEETFTYRISGGRFEEPFIVNDIVRLVDDGCQKPLLTPEGRMIESNLSTPITVEGEPVALVIVDSLENNVFTEDDLELMGYLKLQAELALTNLKHYQDVLRLSRYDHLTGTYNRGYFDKLLEESMVCAGPKAAPFTFVIMDMDGLKAVNDRLGHREGDLRLQSFADRFRKVLGAEDLLGRYGGDEFVAVFYGKEQEAVAEQLKTLMGEMAGNCSCCSFSFGTAQYPLDGTTHEELVRTADGRLYTHKRTKNFTRRQEDHGNQHQ